MNLLIDMGNTRLKWAVGNGLDISVGLPICNTDIDRDSLFQLWQAIDPPNQLAISCVSANQLLGLVLSVAKEFWPAANIVMAKSEANRSGVINSYQNPEKLGVDRWLGIIASYHRHQKAFCIVDCGTAITVDVVDNFGRHLGGLISPGLTLMQASLAKGTENLKLSEAAYSFGLATNTDAAIHNGTLLAACGLIELALKNQPYNLQLILTGGNAQTIAAHLSISAIVDPDLVLRGLALTLQGLP
jgi:type III pantothenate kinase